MLTLTVNCSLWAYYCSLQVLKQSSVVSTDHLITGCGLFRMAVENSITLPLRIATIAAELKLFPSYLWAIVNYKEKNWVIRFILETAFSLLNTFSWHLNMKKSQNATKLGNTFLRLRWICPIFGFLSFVRKLWLLKHEYIFCFL